MNHYELSRSFFDWTFENPSKVSPSHIALYFFCIEHCNRLGWKREFGLPTTMAKEAIGIRSYNTYINTLTDLVEWGFIILVEKSKNQYSSNIIALSKFDKAHDKALDKAMIKHMTKRCESTGESIDSIDKHINNITINKEQENGTGDESPTLASKKTIDERKMEFKETLRPFVGKYSNELLKEFYEYWTETNEQGTKFRREKEKFFDLSRRLVTWANREKTNKKSTQKVNEDGEPIDIVKKYELRNQQLRDANR